MLSAINRVATVRFGADGSSGERVFCAHQHSLRDGTVPVPVSGPEKRFLKNGSGSNSVPGKMVLTVPVSGSGSVPALS